MNNLSKYVASVMILALCAGLGALGSPGKPNQHKVLSLCELVDNWKNYNRQNVRVRAIFAVGPEMDWLYDPACRNGKGLTDVEFGKHTKGAIKKLDRLISKDRRNRRAWVTFEGVFYGPEPYNKNETDPKLPARIREWLEKSHRRYGHMDAFDSMIDVMRVVEASEVAPDFPDSKINLGRNIYPGRVAQTSRF